MIKFLLLLMLSATTLSAYYDENEIVKVIGKGFSSKDPVENNLIYQSYLVRPFNEASEKIVSIYFDNPFSDFSGVTKGARELKIGEQVRLHYRHPSIVEEVGTDEFNVQEDIISDFFHAKGMDLNLLKEISTYKKGDLRFECSAPNFAVLLTETSGYGGLVTIAAKKEGKTALKQSDLYSFKYLKEKNMFVIDGIWEKIYLKRVGNQVTNLYFKNFRLTALEQPLSAAKNVVVEEIDLQNLSSADGLKCSSLGMKDIKKFIY